MVEIMAPAGSYEALQGALKAGADSIYFGVEQLNMRSRSANFGFEDLKKIAQICNEKGVKSYLTVNTILYDHDINMLKRICDAAKEAKVTAIIASDIAALQYAKEIGLEIHASTQLNITNIEAVKFYSAYADVMVLARELTLQQITHIIEQIKEQDIRGPKGELIEIEVFCHGALCVAVSGKCYMSIATYNASANRGACLQNCRRAYKLIDEETGDELKVENKYIMSPKDLCTLPFLDKLIEAGVKVLKIEGRGRAPEYAYNVTQAYKEAARAIQEGTFTQEKIDAWMKQLGQVYNRGFWEGGYYMGKKLGEWSGTYGTQATREKFFIGRVQNYFTKPQIAEIHLESRSVHKGDKILVTGTTTGVVETEATSIRIDDNDVDKAEKGTVITMPISEKLRKNDKVFVLVDRQ